jgi:hypothetical protein
MSPYHTDRGAFTGGVLGGGIGAVVGNQSGNSAEGALVGAAIGSLTGAAVGSTLDEIDARNRALIAQQMGRPLRAGAVTIADVVAMSQAGVSDQLIATHIRNNGSSAPVTAQDLITLKRAGVSDAVVQAMQEPAPAIAVSAPPPVAPPPVVSPPVVIEGHFGRPPRPSCRWHRRHHWR